MSEQHDDLSVLLVEDNPADARLVREMFREEGDAPVDVTHATRLHDALAYLQSRDFSVVLLDLTLPDSEGIDTFLQARSQAPWAPIVVLTGLADEEIAATAVREGAQDYLVKGHVDGRILYQSVRYAVERKHAEASLRVSEERFRQLADNVKEAFVIVDLPEFRAVYLSRAWSEIWGRPVDEAYADPNVWLAAIHPDDRAAVARTQQGILEGQPGTVVFRIRRPNGVARSVRARIFPVSDAAGRVYRMVGLVEDITELLATEDQLQQAQKMEAVGRLAGGIAHDFNNLLSAILGFSELVLGELGPDHPVAADVRQIQHAGESAVNLTRQLLAFSRRQILQPQVLQLNDVLRRVEGLLRRVIGEDVTLVVRPTESLQPVSADPGQIEQVIVNLAVNARDAMPHGGRLTIETSNISLDGEYIGQHVEAQAGPHVMIAVTDTGVGMDAETQKRLFEPFFTTKEAGKGTGLGLATVYGIVRQSRGTIWVYSEVGVGTTFKVYLPAVSDQVTAPIRSAPERSVRGGTETVLVVDDQPELRIIAGQILSRHGYTVIEASSGPEAIAKSRLHAGPIHLLLTDVVMAGMGGRQLADLLRAERDDLKPVFMSGYTDDTILRHGFLDSTVTLIQKPFTPSTLLRTIREALERHAGPR